jgi:hypothetical protein
MKYTCYKITINLLPTTLNGAQLCEVKKDISEFSNISGLIGRRRTGGIRDKWTEQQLLQICPDCVSE